MDHGFPSCSGEASISATVSMLTPGSRSKVGGLVRCTVARRSPWSGEPDTSANWIARTSPPSIGPSTSRIERPSWAAFSRASFLSSSAHFSFSQSLVPPALNVAIASSKASEGLCQSNWA